MTAKNGNGSIEHMQEELARLRAEIERLTAAGADTIGDKARQAVADVTEQAKDQALAAEHVIEGVVKDRPLTSMLVAAGVGLVIGTLLWR